MIDDAATSWIPTTIVWIPMLDADELPAAVEASAQFTDRPTPQFWDGSRLLGKEVARSLGMAEWTAWDIYLFYPPGAEWGAAGLPAPEAALAQAAGVVIGAPGTLPPAGDASRLPPRLQGRALVVGEQAELPALLGHVARDVAHRHPRS